MKYLAIFHPKAPMPDFFKLIFLGPKISVYFSGLMELLLCEQIAYGRITFHSFCFFLKWMMLVFFLSAVDVVVQIFLMARNIKSEEPFAPLCGSEQM